MNKLKNEEGFTLIEMVIVITIIALLGAVLIKGAGWIGTSNVSAAAQQVRTLRDGSVAFKTSTGAVDYTGIAASALTTRNLAKVGDTISPWGGTNVVAPNATVTKLDITIAGTPDATTCGDLGKTVNSFYGADVSIASVETTPVTICTGGACTGTCGAAATGVKVTFNN